MNGFCTEVQKFGQHIFDVFKQDGQYVSDVWNGNVPQTIESDFKTRNAKLILAAVRAFVGLATLSLACQLLRAAVRLPRMTAFSFLDTTLVILFKAIVLHDLFKVSFNLTSRGNLDTGIITGLFSEPSEGNGHADQLDRNGRPLNAFLAGTLVPSVWNWVLDRVQNQESDYFESTSYYRTNAVEDAVEDPDDFGPSDNFGSNGKPFDFDYNPDNYR